MTKITVAIPTIDGRGKYLESCLSTCVSQDYDFEILVSDNPGGEAFGVVKSFNDSRIKYVRPPSHLPMSAHWDFVLSQASGELITFIGDDDGLMPGCIRRVSDIVSAVGLMPIHHSMANYHWPDFSVQSSRNTTVFFHSTGWGSKIVRSSEFLDLASRARARYIDGPMVYHNFVPTALLNSMLDDNGVFFRRMAPDVYSSIAVAANSENYFSTNELLTISGQGSKANGAAVQSGKGAEFLKDANQFYRPRFESITVQSMLLDSIMEVAENFNRPDLLSSIKYSAHFAKMFNEAQSMHKNDRIREVKIALLNKYLPFTALNKLTSKFENILSGIGSVYRGRPYNIEFDRGHVLKMHEGVLNIFDASKAIDHALSNSQYNSSPGKKLDSEIIRG